MTVHGQDFDHARRVRGALACKSGALAEEQVAMHYETLGYTVLESRWRGPWGEIDLILQLGDCTIFVEVKKSRTHAEAALRLDRRQMDRICASASEYCGRLPAGLLSEMRFDLAMVDELGRIELIEIAFGEN